jgi:hypothetical protein
MAQQRCIRDRTSSGPRHIFPFFDVASRLIHAPACLPQLSDRRKTGSAKVIHAARQGLTRTGTEQVLCWPEALPGAASNRAARNVELLTYSPTSSTFVLYESQSHVQPVHYLQYPTGQHIGRALITPAWAMDRPEASGRKRQLVRCWSKPIS